jgi:hypothetical protein
MLRRRLRERDYRAQGTARMTAPRVCAVRQAQDLRLLAVDPCGCDPAQVGRCAEEKRRDDYYLNMAGHAAQVLELHAAAGDFLKNLDDRVPAVTWDVVSRWKRFRRLVDHRRRRDGLRRSTANLLWPTNRGQYQMVPALRPWRLGSLIEMKPERWRQWKFGTPYTKYLSDRDIGAVFVAMLYLADDLDDTYARQHPRLVLPYCDAPTPSARAYQAAAAVLTAFYDCECVGVATYEIASARIVTEVFDSCLLPRQGKPKPELPDFFVVSKLLDKSEDFRRSPYTVGATYHRDESSIRARFVQRLQAIDAQLGKYCKSYNSLAYPPQSAQRGWYNVSIFGFGFGIASRLIRPRPLAEPFVEPPTRTPIDIQPQRQWRRYGDPARFTHGALGPSAEIACLSLVAWAQRDFRNQATAMGLGDFAARRCPAGFAQHVIADAQNAGSGFLHYDGTATTRINGERQYPPDDPAIFWPQPAIEFIKHDDLPDKAHHGAALRWRYGVTGRGASFRRWSSSYLTNGISYSGRASEKSEPRVRNDLVELIEAERFGDGFDETAEDPDFLRGSDQQSDTISAP